MDNEISSAYEPQLNSQVISTPNHNALVYLYSDDTGTSEQLQTIELVNSSTVEAAVKMIMAVNNDLEQLQLDSDDVQEELTTLMFRLDDINTVGDLAAQSLRTSVLAKVQATLKQLQAPSSNLMLEEAAASLPSGENCDAALIKFEEPLIEFDSPETSRNSSEIYYDILHSSSSTDEYFKSVSVTESKWVLEPTQISESSEESVKIKQESDDIPESPKQEHEAANMILSDADFQTLLSDLNIQVEQGFDLVKDKVEQHDFGAEISQGELVKISRDSSVDGQASKSSEESCKSETSPEEGPIQLLLQDADGKFSINEEALHYVLASVKDRKLAIVSIVGAFRRGKSFLLNFLLRYLKAGLAVLLMDTQGTFDSLTSMNENAFMFALSTLASSVQIYNLSERIQMDDLQNLQYFLEFGRLVQDASNSKVFSKLLFLVRDWRYPEELKFGFEGGAQLLNEVFKSNVGQMQVEMLNTCFDEVECCLLPHPGEAVYDDQHFKGLPNDMRPEFVSYLWLLVEHIFQPGNLPAKKIGDIFVTGEELQAYLCTFVERLQSSSLSPKTLFQLCAPLVEQALSNTANERARKKALAFYTKEMEACLGTTEDIAELHKTLHSQALQMFDSACCFGEDKDTNPHRIFIMELLEDRFNQLVSQLAREEREQANEVRYHLSEAANRAVSQYRLSMELEHSASDLEHSHQQVRVQALMIFEPLLAIYPLHLCRPFISQAKQDIQKLYLAFKVREEKTLKQQRADMLREAHTAAVQNYQLSMEKYGAGVEALLDLEKLHESVFASALAPLHFLHDDSEELGQCLARAAEDIEVKHQMYIARNAKLLELQNDQELMKLTLLSKNALQTYENAMLKQCNSKTTIITLADMHIKVREECIGEFQHGTAGCNPEKVAALLQTLQKDLAQKFEDVCEEHARKLSDAREKARNRGLKENYAIGIDLGTTNCCVAVYIDGKVKIITNNIGKTTTPSTVYFEQDGYTFGEAAIMRGFSDPVNCVSEMKRIIGRSFNDPVVTSLVPRWSFKVKEGDGDPMIHVTKGKRKQWKPEEISGLVLGEMRRIASVFLDTEIFDAVVTIPAYFNELQREATKRACAQAGLNILRIINEPTAAAIAYGVQNPSEQPRTVLVFDFGGGTCDVSILQMEKKRYTVMASYGDNKLGGEDFDDILMDHLVQKFEEKHPLKLDQRDKRRLRRQCERAKRDLTDYYEGEIVVERVAGTISDLRETVTRKQFLALTSDLFPRVLMPVKQCLQEAKLRPSDIDEVVLVGGSSRLLPIQELLSDFFRGKKLHVRTDPDEAIAFGAAIQAAISSGQHGENPPVIREITPMSLGVGVYGNRMHIITPKNTPLPTKSTYRFQTVENFQEEVVIEVYQGENVSSACKNTLLGTFTMHNIRKAPAGQVQLDETFSINEDGILSVTAVEVGTKNVVQVKVQKPVK